MKKHLEIVHNIAMALFVCGFVLEKFLKIEWGEYLIWAFGILWILEMIWKFAHWKQFAKENKENLISLFIISIIFVIIYFFVR